MLRYSHFSGANLFRVLTDVLKLLEMFCFCVLLAALLHQRQFANTTRRANEKAMYWAFSRQVKADRRRTLLVAGSNNSFLVDCGGL